MNWRAPPEHTVADIVWHRVIRPEGNFVREEAFGGIVEYGPMPKDKMIPLIEERKEFFSNALKKMVQRTAIG